MTEKHRDTPVDDPSQATVADTEQQVADLEAKEPTDATDEVGPADEVPQTETVDESAEQSEATAEIEQEQAGLEEPFEEDDWHEEKAELDEELDSVVDNGDTAEDAAEQEETENETVELDTVEEPTEETEEQDAVTEDDEESEDSAEQDEAMDEAPEAEETEETEAVEEQPPTVESVIEAILFATDEPLTDGRLSSIVETTGKQVRDCIKALNEKYEQNHNAFRIEQIAGGYQMLTLSTYNSWLRKMLRARSDSKLSPAAMETLAIIAYKQPVIRVDIEAIRGVAVGEVIRSLMYKGLVKIVGRAEILGRPMLYGTTKKFLEVFGLNTLKDLPKVEELKKPD